MNRTSIDASCLSRDRGGAERVVMSLASGQSMVAMGSQLHVSLADLELQPCPTEEFPTLQVGVGSQL